MKVLPALGAGLEAAPKLKMASEPAASRAMPILKMEVSSSSSCKVNELSLVATAEGILKKKGVFLITL